MFIIFLFFTFIKEYPLRHRIDRDEVNNCSIIHSQMHNNEVVLFYHQVRFHCNVSDVVLKVGVAVLLVRCARVVVDALGAGETGWRIMRQGRLGGDPSEIKGDRTSVLGDPPS